MKPGRLTRKCLALAGEQSASAVEVRVPPSTNELFIWIYPKGKPPMRVKSGIYRDWIELVTPDLARLKPPMRYPCELVFTVIGKVNEVRDLDNLLKPLIDTMVKAGALAKDTCKHVRKESIEYRPEIGRDGMVRVEIIEAARTGQDLLDLLS
jgi:Holliday junction resolvase RusA-like endonuclease